jgi:DNA polymerase-3 subunit alpha
MLMGKTYGEFGRMLNADQFVMVRGRVSQRDDAKNINAQRIEVIEAVADGSSEPVLLHIRDSQATKPNLEDLDRTLRAYAGESEVFVNMLNSQKVSTRFKLQPTVRFSVALISEIKAIFGSKVFIGGDDLVDLNSSLVGPLVVDQGIPFSSDQAFFNFDDNDGIRFD